MLLRKEENTILVKFRGKEKFALFRNLTLVLSILVLLSCIPSSGVKANDIARTQESADYLADVTFYNYYSKYQTSDTSDNSNNDHYSFEKFNEVISNYARDNGMLYPLYFGDFNGAAGSSNNPEINPSQGQPLNGKAANFYWAINRANRNANYSASLQGLVSNQLDSNGNITQDQTVSLVIDSMDTKEYKYKDITVDGGLGSYSIVNDKNRKNVLKATLVSDYSGKQEAFRIKLPVENGVENYSKNSRYLIFDIYNETNGEGDPFVALRDKSGRQIAGWSDSFRADYFTNNMGISNWKTIVVDLEQLRNNTNAQNGVNDPKNFNFGEIECIWIGSWSKGNVYIDNIKFSSDMSVKSEETVKLPYFDSDVIKGNVGETIEGLEFPFKKKVKNNCYYYVFGSGKSGYTSDNSKTDVVRINRQKNHLDYWFDINDDDPNIVLDMNGINGWGGGTTSPGFFPFNDSSASSNIGKLTYGFGSKIEIPFTLTSSGEVKDLKGNNVPIQFNFKGDDDVWVYVDGNLILDMGGAHSKTTGNINFKNRVATVDNVVKGSLESNSLYQPVEKSEKKFKLSSDSYVNQDENEGYDTKKVHVLTMYYMERGMIESNLYVDFNFIPLDNELIVEKEVDTSGVNESLREATDNIAKNEEFNFKISQNDQIKSDLDYKLNENGKISDKSMNGENFSLKHGSTATFYSKFNKGSNIKVYEEYDDRFTINWITKDLTSNRESLIAQGSETETDPFKIITSHIPYDNMVHYVRFNNKINTGDLSIGKIVVGAKEDGKVFNFKITFKSILGKEVSPINYNGKYYIGDEERTAININGNYIIQLKDGEVAKIKGIPLNTKYEIEEIVDPGYIVSEVDVNGIKDNDISIVTGEIDGTNTNHEVIYTNKTVMGDIIITKVDKNYPNKVLEGAEFKIQKLNSDDTIDENFKEIVAVTDDNGQVIFKDLIYGKYLITETKAPEGYELLKEPIQVEINKENNGVIEKKVYNKKNINLPFVGGRGTIIYILVGNIFVFSALLIYKSLIINFKNHSKSYKLNGKLKGEVYENKEEF